MTKKEAIEYLKKAADDYRRCYKESKDRYLDGFSDGLKKAAGFIKQITEL